MRTPRAALLSARHTWTDSTQVPGCIFAATNAHSRKLDNHKAAVSLWVEWYNFCRVNSAIRCTPAMQAGLATTIWTMWDLLATGI